MTGIGTGTLIAPFAFLGSQYDQKLQQAYTNMSSKDVLIDRWYTAALWDDALADNAPLRDTRRARLCIDSDMLNAIAAGMARAACSSSARPISMPRTSARSRRAAIQRSTSSTMLVHRQPYRAPFRQP